MGFWGGKDKDDEDAKKISSKSALTIETSTKEKANFSGSHSVAVSPVAANTSGSVTSGLDEGRIRSALGAGTVIQGKLSFDSTVSIDGKLTGEIHSSKTLVIGKSGLIDAKIEVSILIVRGVVKGHITATEKIEIRDGGQIIGDVVTPSFIMDDGCIFQGACSMKSAVSNFKKDLRS